MSESRQASWLYEILEDAKTQQQELPDWVRHRPDVSAVEEDVLAMPEADPSPATRPLLCDSKNK